jgi:PilZ domain
MNGETNVRKNSRHRVLKQGKIIFGDMTVVIDVTIRDMSAGGLRVQLPMCVRLPRDFSILIVSESLIYSVAMRWRKGDLMGVEFVGEPIYMGEDLFT